MSNEALLDASKISVEYVTQKNTKIGIDSVSLKIPSTKYTIGVVGESGSGKTTLGMSLMNLINRPGKITSGKINYMGRNILDMTGSELRQYRWKEVSMIFQSAMNSLNPVKRAADHIVEVIRNHKPETSRYEARETSLRLLTEVGIESEHVDDFPHELSGGMRQRVVIALALALSPKLVIADEPTSALDVVVQKQILALLQREISERQLSLVFITHDIPILAGLVEFMNVMFGGEVVETGPATKIFSNPLHPYTEELLDSLLTLDLNEKKEGLEKRKRTRGMTKPISAIGCKYQYRCKYAFDRCKNERPILKQIQNERYVACHKYS